MTKDKPYAVVADGEYIKKTGTFKECVKWCHDIHWAHDAFKTLQIVKLVCDGKTI